MRSQFDDDGSGPDVSEVVAEVSQAFRRNVKRFGPLLLVLLAVLIGAMGIYKVDPGEQGVVRRFGREHRKSEAGLHYRVPLIETVDVVNVEQIRRIEVGVRGQEQVPHEALMLTGDENIVEVQMVVQFRVAEASKYLFRLKDPIEALHATAEVALRSMVGRTRIDDVITTGRERVQAETRIWLQRLMDEYDSGLEVLEVRLRGADAPDQVRDAFHAVTRAREEKEKLINEARGYNEDRLPRARGEAQKNQRNAEAYKEERVLAARGDAAKFKSVLREYALAKDVTRKRLYLETMERVLGRVDGKVFVDERVADGSVPVLPIGLRGAAALTALEAPRREEGAE
jgi:modulator of FtsH protease HflK